MTLTVHIVALVFGSLAALGHGRRTQISSERLQSSMRAAHEGDIATLEHSLTLAKSLLALSPADFRLRTGSIVGVRPMAMNSSAMRFPMHGPAGTVTLPMQAIERFTAEQEQDVEQKSDIVTLRNVDLRTTLVEQTNVKQRRHASLRFGENTGLARLLGFGVGFFVLLLYSFMDKFVKQAYSESKSTEHIHNVSMPELVLGPETKVHQQHPVARYSRAATVQMSAEEGESRYQLYPQRWVQLAYLSAFALLSDWVCFSTAAAPALWQSTYGHDSTQLVDIFFFTNVLFCFLEPTIVGRFGLRPVVVGAGFMMAIGCLLRSGIPFDGSLMPYQAVIAGTVLVGAAQPFFQCTPPLLSATWFGTNERAQATAIAINFNQVGIATAFLVGGSMMQDASGVSRYFSVITITSLLVAAGALFQFQERPVTPPTSSAAARIRAVADGNGPPTNLFETGGQLLKTPGFLQPLAAFVASIGVSNVVSNFVEDELQNAGFLDQNVIDVAGAGFQAAIVIGGIVLGGYVDRSKDYKKVTMGCILGALVLLPLIGGGGLPKPVVLLALLGLGGLIGPVQPINAELAVEVAYPADENSIEALQQLCGNLFTALILPVAENAETVSFPLWDAGPSIRGDTLLLAAIALSALTFFNSFDGELKRTALDCAGDPGVCEVDVGLPDSAEDATVGS
jgi:FLVCR family feline leukemia virus subgroup C receptor-related protein